MSLTPFGDVCASCGKDLKTGKGKYLKIGYAFKDDRGSLVIKLDTLPLPSANWEGWVNVFEKNADPSGYEARVAAARAKTPSSFPDDEVPF